MPCDHVLHLSSVECKCSVCVCVYVCGFVYAVDRLHDLSGETESVYANIIALL